jgi:hypothetical protein
MFRYLCPELGHEGVKSFQSVTFEDGIRLLE